MGKQLFNISTVNQLVIELVRRGWRKSPNQQPPEDDPFAPYFSYVNIENTAGGTFKEVYFRRVDIYPQGEGLADQIGLTALISSDGRIIRWEVFRHYSGCSSLTVDLSKLELTPDSIGRYLKLWKKGQED